MGEASTGHVMSQKGLENFRRLSCTSFAIEKEKVLGIVGTLFDKLIFAEIYRGIKFGI